jgi:hypothetical protein
MKSTAGAYWYYGLYDASCMTHQLLFAVLVVNEQLRRYALMLSGLMTWLAAKGRAVVHSKA